MQGPSARVRGYSLACGRGQLRHEKFATNGLKRRYRHANLLGASVAAALVSSWQAAIEQLAGLQEDHAAAHNPAWSHLGGVGDEQHDHALTPLQWFEQQ